jgi:hypothetical protein
MTNILQELAREALAVQDACNLSGVVHSFAKAITHLREALPNAGTDEINAHPVCALWSDKIAHLTGTQTFGQDAVMRAYKWAHDMTRDTEATEATV